MAEDYMSQAAQRQDLCSVRRYWGFPCRDCTLGVDGGCPEGYKFEREGRRIDWEAEYGERVYEVSLDSAIRFE